MDNLTRITKKILDPNIFKDLKDDMRTQYATRIETLEMKYMQLAIEMSYSMLRQYQDSDLLIDTFINEDYTEEDYETSTNKIVDVMDDNEWNNNWKQYGVGGLDFKQGFLRPERQQYMLQQEELYNLEGVGQSNKCSLSRYDTTRDCYWLMTNGGANTIGEIVKLSTKMREGKVEVLARWYLEAGGASTAWTGIEIDETEEVLVVVLNGDGTSGGWFEIPVNNDGTIGTGHTPNGGSLAMSTSADGSDTYDNTAYSACDADYFPQDITIWDDDDYAIIACDNVSDPSPTKLIMEGRGSTIGNFTSPTNTDITGLEYYLDGNDVVLGRSIIRNGNDLWIKINDITRDYRFIYKFNIEDDIVSNTIIKCSGGRFRITRNVDTNDYTSEGISISKNNKLLEVCSTSSNGKFIVERSIKNAKWAENQVCEEIAFESYDSTNVPNNAQACMIEDERYYWTGDANAGANAVDVFRYDTQDGTFKHARLTGAGWDDLFDLTHNPTTDVLYLLGSDNTNYEIYYGDLSDFVALMGNSYNTGNTIELGTDWGTEATNHSTTTKNRYGICYDEDDDILYISNDTDDVIDTLSIDGTTYTEGVYDLPAPNNYWGGIAYKNDKIYIVDSTGTTNSPNFIYVIDKDLSNDTAWYRLHIYQDPAPEFTTDYSIEGIDFNGNALVCTSRGHNKFFSIKTLEDPTVLQIHTFIDSSNVLMSDNVNCQTDIVERYFEPDEFTEWMKMDETDPTIPYHSGSSGYVMRTVASKRNVPDKHYMALGYNDEGMSILHLDRFLSNVNTSGNFRYDVRDIGVWDFEEGADNLIDNDSSEMRSIGIEKELIITTDNSGASFIIDLKTGFSTKLNTGTDSGHIYQGTISERNDALTYDGSYNSELNISNSQQNKINIHTFTKGDISDYSKQFPTTYVAIGTDGGCDLLVIDWDENNNRTPVKVWNNVFNSTTIGENGNFIAKNGYLFGGLDNTNGNIYYVNDGVNNLKVWEIQADTIGSNSILETNGFVKDIKEYAIYKTPSGEWRHLLVIGTLDNSGNSGFDQCCIVDVENATQENLWYLNGAYNHTSSVDACEDLVFSLESFFNNTQISSLNIFKKEYFDTNNAETWRGDSYLQNNWDYLTGYGIWYQSRPYFGYSITSENGDLAVGTVVSISYSKNYGILQHNSARGIQMYHFNQLNNCIHKSIEININNPEYIHYKQTLIEPFTDHIS